MASKFLFAAPDAASATSKIGWKEENLTVPKNGLGIFLA